MSAQLVIEHVCKSFGGVTTASDVNMKVHAGEVHGLIGPNGAGKTTMLNLISGIYTVDSGKIYLCGQEITNIPSHQRAKMGLGRTFQVPRFLARANIRDNLMVGIDLANPFGCIWSFLGRRGLELKKNVEPLLELAGFTVDWNAEISSLTFGQRKLLEIIRSMIVQPKVILVDEPAAGLNDSEKLDAIRLLSVAAHERGIGVVLIEHSMDMIANICQNITVINFGKVIGQGTPQEIFQNEAVIEAYLGRRKDA